MCMTHAHNQRCGVCLREWGGAGTTVTAWSIKYIEKKIIVTSPLQKAVSKELENKSQIERKYMQKHLIKDYYPKYTKDIWNSTIRQQTTQLKNGPRPQQISHQRTHTDGKWIYAPHHMSSGKCKLKQQDEWPKFRLPTTKASEYMEQQELSYIAHRNAKWCNHFGRQFGDFLQNKINSYHTSQKLHYLVYTLKTWKTYVHTNGCL